MTKNTAHEEEFSYLVFQPAPGAAHPLGQAI
jgi:hypothetical protein